MTEIKNVLLDCSFCIRLLKKDAEYHENTVGYFRYFLENNTEMYLSAIVVSEYAVGDNPNNLLSLNCLKLLEFDFNDAKTSGMFRANLQSKDKISGFGENRKIVINDIKLFAQLKSRNIDAYITSDNKSRKMFDRLFNQNTTPKFINLSTPINQYLGRLF